MCSCPLHLHSFVLFSDWLSAMDMLTIGKVMEYAYQKVYGDGGKVDKEGEKIDCKNCLEILCMNQVSIYILLCMEVSNLQSHSRSA